jgi:hypothetical protein
VLYLKRPTTQQCAVACYWAGRFRYSDLKEAAPDGMLCTLNGAAGVLRVGYGVGADMIRCFDGRMERLVGSSRPDLEAGDTVIRAVRAGGDKGSAYAPRHVQRSRM